MISIIVPVYKVKAYLRQCINSLLIQTCQDIEILLIDDGSPDNCGEICEEYAQIDNRIRVFHTENRGLPAARNLGLQEARGDYIGFVDSDDWIEPDMYEVLLRQLEETGADISVCELYMEYTNIHPAGKIVPNAVYAGTDAIRELVSLTFYNFAWNKLYKRTCWNNVLFPEGCVYEDVATLYKAFLNSSLVSCTSKALYHYRLRKSSLMQDHSMNSLMDHWNAHYNRYLYLSAIPEIRKCPKCMNKMEEALAKIAVRIWQWVYCVPKEKRDDAFLHTVSRFIRDHFPKYGRREWSPSFRIRVFCSRYVSNALFAVLYAFNSSKYVIRFTFFK